jgi:hypothetical protein
MTPTMRNVKNDADFTPLFENNTTTTYKGIVIKGCPAVEIIFATVVFIDANVLCRNKHTKMAQFSNLKLTTFKLNTFILLN